MRVGARELVIFSKYIHDKNIKSCFVSLLPKGCEGVGLSIIQSMIHFEEG